MRPTLSLLFNYHYCVLHLMVEQFTRWKRHWPVRCDQAKITTLAMFRTSTQWGQIKRLSTSFGNRTRARSDKWGKLRIGKFGGGLQGKRMYASICRSFFSLIVLRLGENRMCLMFVFIGENRAQLFPQTLASHLASFSLSFYSDQPDSLASASTLA